VLRNASRVEVLRGLRHSGVEEMRVALERDERVCVARDRLNEFDVPVLSMAADTPTPKLDSETQALSRGRIPRSRGCIVRFLVVTAALFTAGLFPGTAESAVVLTLERNAGLPGTRVDVRLLGGGYSPGSRWPVFLSNVPGGSQEAFLPFRTPLVIEFPGFGRVRIEQAPATLVVWAESGRDIGLKPWGSMTADPNGIVISRFRVPELPEGEYGTFVFCETCGGSLIGGPVFRLTSAPGDDMLPLAALITAASVLALAGLVGAIWWARARQAGRRPAG
jgi:hypothetical protein